MGSATSTSLRKRRARTLPRDRGDVASSRFDIPVPLGSARVTFSAPGLFPLSFLNRAVRVSVLVITYSGASLISFELRGKGHAFFFTARGALSHFSCTTRRSGCVRLD